VKSDKERKPYDRLVKYTGVFGGVQGLVTLITILRTSILSRFLGPAGFGINDSFNRTLNLVKSSTDLGISFSAVRKISGFQSKEKDAAFERSLLVVRSWALLTALAGMLVCLLMAPLFSRWAFEGDRNYTLSFWLLSPVVFCSAVNGGEMAVLKGSGRLKEIAISQLIVVVAALCISVPILWYMRIQGLVPSIVLVSAASMAVTCFYSFRAFPYRVSFVDRQVFVEGLDMIKLGVFFTVASFLGSGALSVIVNYLMKNGGAEVTGAYGAGYMLVSYLGMFVFSAMEADYFPRLSAVNTDSRRVSSLANRQAEVALLLVSPMSAFFIVLLPLVVTVFLSHRFAMAVPMTRLAVLSLAFKAMTQPIAYISLAKGDSRTFLLQESLYDVFLVLAVITGFRLGGLRMTGMALFAAGVADMVFVASITSVRYGFRYSRLSLKVMAFQLPLLVGCYLSQEMLNGVIGTVTGLLLASVSTLFSFKVLKRHSTFITDFWKKLRSRSGLYKQGM